MAGPAAIQAAPASHAALPLLWRQPGSTKLHGLDLHRGLRGSRERGGNSSRTQGSGKRNGLTGLGSGFTNPLPLAFTEAVVNSDSQANQIIEGDRIISGGEFVLQGTGKSVLERPQKGLIVPATLCGHGPELNGELGYAAGPLTEGE